MPILKYDLFCDVTNSFRNDGFMKSGIDFGLKKSFTISHKTLYTENFLLITSEFVFYFFKNNVLNVRIHAENNKEPTWYDIDGKHHTYNPEGKLSDDRYMCLLF